MKSVRRGGTVSISGVYGGEVDPLPIMEMFDRGIHAHGAVPRAPLDRRYPPVLDQTTTSWASSLWPPTVSLEEAPAVYDMFQAKSDGCVKVVLSP